MKRSILSVLGVAAACLVFAASASAHVVTVVSGSLTCTSVTVNWTKFPGGPFNLNLAFQDQVGSKLVKSPYIVAGLTGASGSQAISAPAGSGVTYRKVTITWTIDGGGSVTATASVKCPTTPPVTTTTGTTTTGTTTTPTTTPTQTVTVTTPGVTTTVPTTVTVTAPAVTVTTPAVTTTVPVNVAGPTVTTAGPTTTTTIPGKGKTIVKRITKTKIVYRPLPVTIHCPKGEVGSSVYPINKSNKLIPGKPIISVCKKLPKHAVQDTGVTG